ncbi:MAG: biopolymer transporter ExbD [Vicinamibacterales bacterium]
MSMDTGGAKGGPKSEINVTPLVDVMLVLLIIMMLIAPMLQKGVPVQLPLANNGTQKPDTQDQTVVSIDAQNQLWVNGLQFSKEEFGSHVKSALEDKKDKIVLIKGDQDAKYSAVMEAMDALRAAQIEDIALITDPKNPPPTTTGGK